MKEEKLNVLLEQHKKLMKIVDETGELLHKWRIHPTAAMEVMFQFKAVHDVLSDSLKATMWNRDFEKFTQRANEKTKEEVVKLMKEQGMDQNPEKMIYQFVKEMQEKFGGKINVDMKEVSREEFEGSKDDHDRR